MRQDARPGKPVADGVRFAALPAAADTGLSSAPPRPRGIAAVSTAPRPKTLDDILQEFSQHRKLMQEELQKVIVGQQDVIEQLFAAIFTRGHCLLEGVPGLAKTLMVSTLARILDVGFKRVQFTPDLMPSDITGTNVLEEDDSGRRNFRFVEGPIFTNILLADEINRTPPKTQAALLQAMQEREVSVGQETYSLPDPFFTIATQNPIEQASCSTSRWAIRRRRRRSRSCWPRPARSGPRCGRFSPAARSSTSRSSSAAWR
jgi:MoxR-like ATPase